MELLIQAGLVTGCTGVLGVVVGGIIQTRAANKREVARTAEDARYLAVTVSGLLDDFAGGCADVMYDNGDESSERRATAPALTLSGLDVNWRSLPPDLLDRTFAVPRAHKLAMERIEWERWNDPEEGWTERQYQYTLLGMLAGDVSKALRTHVGLPPRTQGLFDVYPLIEDQKLKLDGLREEREKQNAEMHARLAAGLPKPPEGF
ncbi:hypothetical protein VDR83_11085 [Xanthomonas campestris pv. campestris]|uniref:hypothetical protein n=1 Tax=Xanthomonas campestris TaxID=339 RepID=UPI0025A06B47|nr:hypothetical protein [Xanthomonas campestris]MDM7696988.1 hypothetical protein [Xanthomonas campestris pv. campestris]MEB1942412.1 hypothetical protein [Xanthomonas campestris pv. campestris]